MQDETDTFLPNTQTQVYKRRNHFGKKLLKEPIKAFQDNQIPENQQLNNKQSTNTDYENYQQQLLQQGQGQAPPPVQYRYKDYGVNGENPSPVRERKPSEGDSPQKQQKTPLSKQNQGNFDENGLEIQEAFGEQKKNNQKQQQEQENNQELQDQIMSKDNQLQIIQEENQLLEHENEFNDLIKDNQNHIEYKNIYCIIRSCGQKQKSPDFEKARSFAKRILKLESELDEFNANLYTQPQNFQEITQKSIPDQNMTIFLAQVHNLEEKDFQYLQNYTYTSKTGSNIQFSVQRPSLLTLNQVPVSMEQQNQKNIQKKKSLRIPTQMSEPEPQYYFDRKIPETNFDVEFTHVDLNNEQSFEQLAIMACSNINKQQFKHRNLAGKILIGVSADGVVKGCQVPESFQEDFLKYLYEQTLPTVNELVKINICDIENSQDQSLKLVEIEILRNHQDRLIGLKAIQQPQQILYFSKSEDNQILPLQASQLCMYVPERLTQRQLQSVVQKLEENLQYLQENQQNQQQEQRQNRIKVLKRHETSRERGQTFYSQSARPSHKQYSSKDNNSSSNNGDSEFSSPVKKHGKILHKRDIRSFTQEGQNNNNKQHSLFKTQYDKKPNLIQQQQRQQLPKAGKQLQQQQSQQNQQNIFQQQQQQQQQNLYMNIPVTNSKNKNNINLQENPDSMRYNQSNNSNSIFSTNVKENNSSTLPPTTSSTSNKKQNKGKNNNNPEITEFNVKQQQQEGKYQSKKEDSFLQNNTQTLVQRENMLNTLGFKEDKNMNLENLHSNMTKTNQKLQKIMHNNPILNNNNNQGNVNNNLSQQQQQQQQQNQNQQHNNSIQSRNNKFSIECFEPIDINQLGNQNNNNNNKSVRGNNKELIKLPVQPQKQQLI